jgi:hypothetical protein
VTDTAAGHPEATPSGRRLVWATVAALIVAAAVLVVAVLPAEYGLDPLGTGRALGLMPTPPPEAAAPATATGDAQTAPTMVGPIAYFPAPFATDRAAFELGPYDYVEYKYRLEQGASLQFAWEATVVVPHDFHADPDGADDHDEVSFDKQERARAAGSYTAPFAGMHGWFWENPGPTPITVTISTSGFYSAATEFRPNKRRIEHAITRR